MRIEQEKLVSTVVDRICDVCEESVMIDIRGQKFEEVGEISATWGYGSQQDGKVFHLDLCEHCFTVALQALSDHKKSHIARGKKLTPPDENFGLDTVRSN